MLIDIFFLLLDLWEVVGHEVVGLGMYVPFLANVGHFPLYKGMHLHQFLHCRLANALCFAYGVSA